MFWHKKKSGCDFFLLGIFFTECIACTRLLPTLIWLLKYIHTTDPCLMVITGAGNNVQMSCITGTRERRAVGVPITVARSRCSTLDTSFSVVSHWRSNWTPEYCSASALVYCWSSNVCLVVRPVLVPLSLLLLEIICLHRGRIFRTFETLTTIVTDSARLCIFIDSSADEHNSRITS